MGYFSDAETQFKQAIKLQPKYSQAYFNLGTFYQSQDKNAQALEYYNKAAALGPASTDTYMNIGYIYAEEGQYKKAAVYLQKVLALDANNADAYYGLGMAYFMSDQYLKSRQSFVKAREIFQQRGDREKVANVDKYLDKFFELEKKWKAMN
jgi:superkiller protein 3